ncbi:MAG: hypothetical protein KDE27_22475 [Planctomycetes bacterium]|nr:hypothetical protein [Planctomycetota bacterium]
MWPALVLVLAASAAPQAEGPPLPTQDPTFEQQLAAIVPSAAELEWRSVPWRSAFRDALLEAAEADRPVLLWAMNGHPLGQT